MSMFKVLQQSARRVRNANTKLAPGGSARPGGRGLRGVGGEHDLAGGSGLHVSPNKHVCELPVLSPPPNASAVVRSSTRTETTCTYSTTATASLSLPLGGR